MQKKDMNPIWLWKEDLCLPNKAEYKKTPTTYVVGVLPVFEA